MFDSHCLIRRDKQVNTTNARQNTTRSLEGIGALLAGNVNVPNNISSLSADYQRARPFFHLVLDGLFAEKMLNPLLPEVQAMNRSQWLDIEQEGLEKVSRMKSGVELGSGGSCLANVVHSAAFLYLLSELTGIWQWISDLFMQGGGHAVMDRGDYFNIHSEGSVAYETGLTHCLTMIVFPNKWWQSAYGEQLELWNHDEITRVVAIEPLFNRTIIFEVANPNYRGVPKPLSCPADRIRQSFQLYYHRVGIDGSYSLPPHTFMIAPSFYKKKKITPRSLALEITPPLLLKAVRRLIRLTR